MGNENSTEMIDWKSIEGKITKPDPCSVDDICQRLNVSIHLDDNKNNANNDDNGAGNENKDSNSNDNNGNNDENKDSNDTNGDGMKALQDALNAMSDDDINGKLKEHGILSMNFKDKNDKIKCLIMIGNVNFWRINAELHPNYKRVKNWLWVHTRYRNEVNGFVELAKDDITDEIYLDIQKRFNKFDGKLAKHSAFEDDMLFKFFKENMAQYVPKLDLLYSQHKKFDTLTKNIKDGFKAKYDKKVSNLLS